MKFILEFPLLIEAQCDHCQVCIHLCPAECLESGENYPVLARPLDCIQCGACAFGCPTGAIFLDEIT
ncbi:MAG: 4Fe-4S ferredoxin [Gemmataceae bacterium]|nr:4Fe-4S ferredoxin [Gemmataceae bacterium]